MTKYLPAFFITTLLVSNFCQASPEASSQGEYSSYADKNEIKQTNCEESSEYASSSINYKNTVPFEEAYDLFVEESEEGSLGRILKEHALDLAYNKNKNESDIAKSVYKECMKYDVLYVADIDVDMEFLDEEERNKSPWEKQNCDEKLDSLYDAYYIYEDGEASLGTVKKMLSILEAPKLEKQFLDLISRKNEDAFIDKVDSFTDSCGN